MTTSETGSRWFLLSRRHHKVLIVHNSVIHSCHGPCNADTQEHVDRITARHITDTRVRILVLDGCHLTGERICDKKIKLKSWPQSAPTSCSPGILVPSATNTMAVTESLIPNVQPKCEATSPMIAVTTPIQRMETTKHKYPPATSGENEKEKR